MSIILRRDIQDQISDYVQDQFIDGNISKDLFFLLECSVNTSPVDQTLFMDVDFTGINDPDGCKNIVQSLTENVRDLYEDQKEKLWFYDFD